MARQRLIDADELKILFPDNGEGSWTYNITVKSYIDAQSTVDAIPIEWIEKYAREICILNEDKILLMLLVDDWRKENDIK